MTREVGLYLHIPFCVRKCAYCDFPSFAGREKDMEAYAEKLCQELRSYREQPFVLSSLYIGGGTPSLLPSALMGQILDTVRDCFAFVPGAECSCECNPGTVTAEKLCTLREGGINRLSFGAQVSQQRLLTLLGRIHTWEQVEEAVALARESGFTNYNLDIMLGLPTQTAEDVRETLGKALALRPKHMSCYGLIVEEGTPLEARVSAGTWVLPDEETERAEYETCRQILSAHGFEQYEISNFALPGFACRHNLDCWRRREYIGVGSSACGFLGNKRYQNPRDLSDYLAGAAPEVTEISPEDARFETMMLGLRTMEGVREEDFFRAHGITLREAFGSKLQASLRAELVRWENGRVFLTRKGMDLQNRVLVDLL